MGAKINLVLGPRFGVLARSRHDLARSAMLFATGTSMKRRRLIMLLGGVAASTACSPLQAIAQQLSGKVWRVAFVLPGAWDNTADRALFDLFREELQKLGYLD